MRILLLFVLAALALLYRLSGVGEYLSFGALKENRNVLLHHVGEHHLLAAAIFIAVYLLTAFFVPGAIAFTLVGGFLFGVIEATVYVSFAATAGAALAFLSSRYLIGHRIQEKFRGQLVSFSRQVQHYGGNYLFVLRVVPIVPFALVNYLAGVSGMSLRKFMIITFAGMLPGAALYAYAGRRIASINKPSDLLSPGFVAAVVLLAIFALMPIFLRQRQRRKEGG